MESADAKPGLPSRWAGVGARLPSALEGLAGPSGGVVELPADLAWSGDRCFDLADPWQRYLYHMTVLTSAVTREHYTSWLNAGLLRSDWGRLRLPPPLREIWQERFPELTQGPAAAPGQPPAAAPEAVVTDREPALLAGQGASAAESAPPPASGFTPPA